MITLYFYNTRCYIQNAHPLVLDYIDAATCYLHDPQLLGIQGTRWNIFDQQHAWDGYHHFLKRPRNEPPYVPAGLRFIVMDVIHNCGVPFQILECRNPPTLNDDRLTSNVEVGKIPLFDYQDECAELLCRHPDGVARMSPRAGKTRTLGEVVRRLGLPTVWTAPTRGIVRQTVTALGEFLGDEVQQISTKDWEEHSNRLINVATAGALLKLPDAFWKKRHCLVGDEVHHYLANKAWGRTMLRNSEHIFHRKGMTGTFFRSNGDDMALLAFMGRVLYDIGSAELLKRGRLVPTYMAWVPIEGPRIPHASGDFWGPQGHGTRGIAKHEFRLDVVSSVAKHLQNKNRTVLVLVATKAQGYAVQKRLQEMYSSNGSDFQFNPVEFVSTDRKKKDIAAILDSFRDHQEVKILIGTSMIGEGIDLPSADALVYAAGSKAAVPYVQSLYRVCTATSGKQYAVVVDFIDYHHPKLLAHSRHRNVVVQQDPVFQQEVLPNLDAFVHWSEHVWVPQKN